MGCAVISFPVLPILFICIFSLQTNAYFLFLLILQLIPQISSLSWFTTVVPLVLVLAVSGVKDAIDDFVRSVLLLKDEKWMNVQVGDIIKLENNNCVTADLLLLSSSEPHSLTNIETAELDSETNLKVKQALTVTAELGDLQKLTEFNGEVKCEAPNNKLDKFTGTLTLRGEKYALDNEKMLLRGCTIRNTEWCFGLVIYAGPDTKLMQNSGKTTFKRTSIDGLMNVLVLMVSLINLKSYLVSRIYFPSDAIMSCFFMHAALPSVCDAGKVWPLLWSPISAICFLFFPPALALHPILADRPGAGSIPWYWSKPWGRQSLRCPTCSLPTSAQGKASAGLF
uniref:Uncharacterized protein n=1 Tax=Anser cygnoides TaxID=8845 RepID=A0A8B9EFZ0_ANSCY